MEALSFDNIFVIIIEILNAAMRRMFASNGTGDRRLVRNKNPKSYDKHSKPQQESSRIFHRTGSE